MSPLNKNGKAILKCDHCAFEKDDDEL